MFLNDSAFIYSIVTFNIRTHYPLYSVTYSVLIVPTNHFETSLPSSFARRKKRELAIIQGQTPV